MVKVVKVVKLVIEEIEIEIEINLVKILSVSVVLFF